MSEDHHAGLSLHSLDSVDEHDLLRRRQVQRRARIAAIVVLVLLAVGGGRTIFSRINNAHALESAVAERTRQYVRVATPTSGAENQVLALPGSLQGFVQAPISARASGYLRRWTHDIGARVKKGELLAEIDTPEIDQQLSQSIAARDQTMASMKLAKSTVERWEALREKDAVSQQDLEERRSAYSQARANLAASEANVERLRQTESFKRIVAPFDGVITRRNVDVGDLIDAGGGNGRALFVLTQTDPLRVYVNVPQSYAHLVKQGQKVNVNLAEMSERKFTGEITRTASAIDIATRTMQVEVMLPNRDGALLPGAYVQVSLPVGAGDRLQIPSGTLVIRGSGIQVATVDEQGKVALKPVRLGRNFGERVEVLDGVNARDRLVLNPADSIANGDQVVVQAAPAAEANRKRQ
jgi:RND family efflux transporter MFP subunit